jgi:DNA-binding response OmpR family regulator
MALHIPENIHWNILVFHENSGVIPSAILPLSMEGYSIRSFNDTESAIKAALEETPDVILICADARDNGWAEPCAVFRKHESLRDIPIILLESTLPADRRKVFAAGCLDCIPYPHEPMELMTKLEALMKLRRMKSSDALMEENGRLRMELAEKRKEEEELIRKKRAFQPGNTPFPHRDL